MSEDSRLLTPEERKPFETAHGAFGVPMMYDIFGLLEAQLAKDEARFQAERERIIKKIEEFWKLVLVMLDRGDYSNGVEAFGIDEGMVQARKYQEGLQVQLQSLKEQIRKGI